MPPTGGKESSINPNMIQRVIAGVAQAVSPSIAGILPQTWMSPQQPLKPIAPDTVTGRLWDYQPGYNLNTSPRPYEGGKGTFELLRQLAECDIVRLMIQTRKDQLDALPWGIRTK